MCYGAEIRGIKTVRILRNISIYFLIALLTACSGGEVKNDSEVSSIGKQRQYIDIDSDVELDFKSAIVLMKDEKYAQAVTVLKSVIEREKRLPAPYINIAIAYNKMGDTKAAEENLISALKIDIGQPVANNELGLLYRKEGKFNAARTAYENAIRDNPEYLPAIRNLGVLCDLYLHDFQCALEQFENYLELKPDDKTAEIWVADVKQRIGK